MFSCHYRDKNIWQLAKRVFSFASFAVVFILIARQANSRDFFSSQYGLPCKECHTKIPKLRDFGHNFKNNGFSLEKKGLAPPVEPISSSKTTPQKNPNESSEADPTSKTQSSEPAGKLRQIFKSQSDNGTYFFSDNPTDTKYVRKKASPNSNRGNTSSIAKIRRPSFEECMGDFLAKIDQPFNSHEIMELFERAERKCAPYEIKQ